MASIFATNSRLRAKFSAWKRGWAAFRDVGQALNGPGEEASAEGRVGDEADAELSRGLPRLLRLRPVEERVFRLHGRDGMHLVRPPDGVRPRLRQAEEANLALLDEAGHGADRLLDWHRWVDTMLVVKVDDVHAEPLQARFAGLHDICGAAIDAVGLALAPHLAEFRGEHDAITDAFDGAADHVLIVTPAVHV
jgi:hypothetical protein